MPHIISVRPDGPLRPDLSNLVSTVRCLQRHDEDAQRALRRGMAAAARLLERFFGILKGWKFPTPIVLTPTHDAGLGLEVWDPQVGGLQPYAAATLCGCYARRSP